MKKIRFLALPMIAAALMFTGCSPEATVNRTPEIEGVGDISCLMHSRVDLLNGVAALDYEDGDITPKLGIVITPTIEVKDGYAVFDASGEYKVEYTVSDSGGETVSESAFVDVVAREKYKSFSQPDRFEILSFGEAKIEKGGMVNGEYILKCTGGILAEDIQLTRTYDLIKGSQYTFSYTISSNVSGKIKAKCGERDIAELEVVTGEQTLDFTHKLLSGEDRQEVEISLCLGSLEGEIDWKILSVSSSFPQQEGGTVDLTQDFSFSGRVLPRFDIAEGNAYAADENSAVVEITKASDEIWRGGMFVNTGITLRAMQKYIISFDAVAQEESPFEVVVQRGQWDEYQFAKSFSPNGRAEHQIEVSEQTQGELWIYVQSGNALNKITLSNLKVYQILSGDDVTNYAIADYTESHNGATDGEGNALFNSVLKSDCGKFVYTIENFSENDYDHKVASYAYYSSGSAENYVITFTAKATQPITMVFAVPILGGWDPTLAWARFTLSNAETRYTIFCGGSSTDSYHQLVWQFGSELNKKYHNVEIEISDVQISIRHSQLDS